MRLKSFASVLLLALLGLSGNLPEQVVRAERPSVRFVFREPAPTAYWVELPPAPAAVLGPVAQIAAPVRTLAASRENSPDHAVQFAMQLVLQIPADVPLVEFIANHPLTVVRTFAPGVVLLEAPDAWTALQSTDATMESLN